PAHTGAARRAVSACPARRRVPRRGRATIVTRADDGLSGRAPMTNPDTRTRVVDDTRFSATLVARTLGQAGHRDVRHASSASEALRVLAEQPVQIVIADWMMPDTDGLALTRRIRQMD